MIKNPCLMLVAAAIVLGCHGGTALGDSGFAVDVPPGWQVSANGRNLFEVEDPRTSGTLAVPDRVEVAVVAGDEAASLGLDVASLDAAVAKLQCEDPAKAIKEITPAGAFFVRCRAPVADVDGKPVWSDWVASYLRSGSTTVYCSSFNETPTALAPAASVCRSLRKR